MGWAGGFSFLGANGGSGGDASASAAPLVAATRASACGSTPAGGGQAAAFASFAAATGHGIFFKNQTKVPAVVEVTHRSWTRREMAHSCRVPADGKRVGPFAPTNVALRYDVRFDDAGGRTIDVQSDVTCEFGDVCVVLQEKMGRAMANIEYLKQR
eukprot:TRINITY_DN11045_c0_g1_i2.p1 TRINITY_DN11045_c0_g1~~TRINITY_DN11045_c0_g1_i2.p1  ORF type:complete len:176 (-),score=36.66 TRINITY_DN11045_c0_g1_i2:159-626(-)